MEGREAQARAGEAIAEILGTKVTEEAVRKAIKSRVRESEIGASRADKIWGWVARNGGVRGSGHGLAAPKGHNQRWMNQSVRPVLEAREEQAWNPSGTNQASAQREEVKGRISAWVRENEEPAEQGAPQILRPAKLKQMKAAARHTTDSRGGHMAVMAALALLAAQGEVQLEQVPKRPNKQGPWHTWITDAEQWMIANKWVDAQTAEATAKAARERHLKDRDIQTMGTKQITRVLDIGEGWGSVGRALRQMGRAIKVVGVDRRGMTYTGTKYGKITAEVTHDLAADTRTDTITAISRKAGVSTKAWSLVWMSPECKLYSRANAMNHAKGCAHGKWALTPLNMANATPQRLQEEKDRTAEADKAVMNQVAALEEHPNLPFALENPWDSELWDIKEVGEAMGRNPTWRIWYVDQCAYGRKSRKPTAILTNVAWRPRGRTGTGTCVAGKCGGTLGNSPGDTEHEEQSTAATREKRNEAKGKGKGRKETTRDAEVNAVEAELVQEIMRATMTAEGKPPPKRRKRC